MSQLTVPMRSIGRIRTETENASHFCQTDVIVEAIVLEEMKFPPRNRCHARELAVSTFPVVHLFFTYFP